MDSEFMKIIEQSVKNAVPGINDAVVTKIENDDFLVPNPVIGVIKVKCQPKPLELFQINYSKGNNSYSGFGTIYGSSTRMTSREVGGVGFKDKELQIIVHQPDMISINFTWSLEEQLQFLKEKRYLPTRRNLMGSVVELQVNGPCGKKYDVYLTIRNLYRWTGRPKNVEEDIWKDVMEEHEWEIGRVKFREVI